MQWKLVGNPVMIAPIAFPGLLDIHAKRAIATLIHSPQPGSDMPYNVDTWDGYGAERARLLGALRDTASPARCSSPVTSTPAGRPTCPSTRPRIHDR